MSVKVHEPVCEDSAQDLYFWFDHFLGDQVKDEWRVAGTGSAVVVDAQTGGIVRLMTGAVSGNDQYIDWNAIRSLLVTKKVSIEVRAKISAATNIGVYLMLFFDWSNYVGFRFDTSLGDTNWLIRAVNGGAVTSQDSGVAPDTDYHIFRIECFPTDEVHFYIGGSEVANSPLTTNIPDDAADYLQPMLGVWTRENATKSTDVDYVVVRQER